MTVPASRVKQFIDPQSSQLIELRSSSGILIGNISSQEALNLVNSESVTGNCSRIRLKYLKLVKHEDSTQSIRERSPLEFLQRMSSARKFSYREHLKEHCAITGQEEWSGMTAWKHKNFSV